jgi:hypothetical protein
MDNLGHNGEREDVVEFLLIHKEKTVVEVLCEKEKVVMEEADDMVP